MRKNIYSPLHFPFHFSFYFILFLLAACLLSAQAKVDLGVDVFFQDKQFESLKGKNIALIINHTSLNQELKPTLALFLEKKLTVKALFSPEHGLQGAHYAGEKIGHSQTLQGLPIYSLHGETKRPSKEMLKNIDVLVYDIQEIGLRPYTYATTLFYAIEEAQKNNIEVIVLDRPNPINGTLVEGPLLEASMRSFLGYINVPYIHGMTIGELALFFNGEYKIKAKIKVIPMKGWKREMSYKDTNLNWIPTSPNIPEKETPFYCASTGILGELELVNIGIGYTMPFKLVGAPWIKAKMFAEKLNSQKLPGVKFLPIYYRPFSGSYKNQNCEGVQIVITNFKTYQPLSVQYLLMGILKSLYPEKFSKKLADLKAEKQRVFCLVNGNKAVLETLKNEKYATWKLFEIKDRNVKEFMSKRAKYLLY